jgi:hypothetical protein
VFGSNHRSHHLLVTAFLYFFYGLPDIKVAGAVNDAPSTAHAGNPVKVFGKIIKLVHESLPGPFTVRRPGIMA